MDVWYTPPPKVLALFDSNPGAFLLRIYNALDYGRLFKFSLTELINLSYLQLGPHKLIYSWHMKIVDDEYLSTCILSFFFKKKLLAPTDYQQMFA